MLWYNHKLLILLLLCKRETDASRVFLPAIPVTIKDGRFTLYNRTPDSYTIINIKNEKGINNEIKRMFKNPDLKLHRDVKVLSQEEFDEFFKRHVLCYGLNVKKR